MRIHELYKIVCAGPDMRAHAHVPAAREHTHANRKCIHNTYIFAGVQLNILIVKIYISNVLLCLHITWVCFSYFIFVLFFFYRLIKPHVINNSINIGINKYAIESDRRSII